MRYFKKLVVLVQEVPEKVIDVDLLYCGIGKLTDKSDI